MGQLLHYTFSKYLELVSILIHLLSVKQTSSASKIDCYTLNLIDFLSWITNPTSIIHSEFRNLGKWTLWSASTAFFQAFERDFPLKFYLFYSFFCIAVAIKVVKLCISSSEKVQRYDLSVIGQGSDSCYLGRDHHLDYDQTEYFKLQIIDLLCSRFVNSLQESYLPPHRMHGKFRVSSKNSPGITLVEKTREWNITF